MDIVWHCFHGGRARILANTPNQAETLPQSLEQAAADIGLHVNAHKTEYMSYNQTRRNLSETGRKIHIPR